MTIHPFDLGLEEVKNYPTCQGCRKKSDGAIRVTSDGRHLCGTHYDEWLASPERDAWYAASIPTFAEAFETFVARLRAPDRYGPIWDAKEED